MAASARAVAKDAGALLARHRLRPGRRLCTPPRAFFQNLFRPKVVDPPAPKVSPVQPLLDAIAETSRGVAVTSAQLKAVKAEIGKLQEDYAESTTTDATLDATWRLLFTTEQETLFIIKNAKLFGTEAGEVYQVIDTEAETLQNVITFPPEGAFIVNSSIAVAGPQRVDFKFTSAALKLPSRDLKVPPFGQGWFDNVYVDGEYRVAVDIRGSLLVVARDGPPRTFA